MPSTRAAQAVESARKSLEPHHPTTGAPMERHVDAEEDGSVVSASDVSYGVQEGHSKVKKSKPSNPESEGEKPLNFVDVVPEVDFIKNMLDKHVYKAGLDGSLPPMNDLEEIFDDISKTAVTNGLKEVIKHLASRELRVVTMCSGTESPILALEMVSKSLRKFGCETLKFQHLFSVEIVPFKQAYIERNFQPPLLFRDVRELDEDEATTAYGARCEVPENPDLLIAGFSCVDFSVLNNERRSLDDWGESGQTFRAILAYVEKHRPPIVVLENVRHAPWKKIADVWKSLGYVVDWKIVDTKHFYLPQTRERGYMICIDASRVDDDQTPVNEWSALVDGFKRPASSPFTSWTLTEDEQGQREQRDILSKRQAPLARAAADWSLYKIRHQDYRREAGLGIKRPISNYQDGGSCRQPDWMDRAWYASQVERVWDTIDMNHLRSLRSHSFDNSYKLRVIDVSQGIDREQDNRPWGVVGCITPCGMQYVTTRGGLLTGLESLALQGLPLDRLNMTRETTREVQDLAGNAMSSTVVGPAILAALIVGHKALPQRSIAPEITDRNGSSAEQVPTLMVEYAMLGRSFSPAMTRTENLYGTIMTFAHISARLCSCEKQFGVRHHGIHQCQFCLHTACSACFGNPRHGYVTIPEKALSIRKNPVDFRDKLSWILPTTLRMSTIPLDIYRQMKAKEASAQEYPDVWNAFLDAIAPVFGDVLRFKSLKRTKAWTTVYEGHHSALHLVIDGQGIRWFLYAKSPCTHASVSIVREILRRPIARMAVSKNAMSLLEGNWEVCSPLSAKSQVQIMGAGELVPSYEARCGLAGAGFADRTVWSQIRIDADDELMNDLDFDIRGDYTQLPDCGGASSSLHVRASNPSQSRLFLFLDPRKVGPPQLDSWVISVNPDRLEDDIPRQTILQLSRSWKQHQQSSSPTSVPCFYPRWYRCQDLALENNDQNNPTVYQIILPNIMVDMGKYPCHASNLPIVSVTADSTGTNVPWDIGPWQALEMNSDHILNRFAWIWARFMNISFFSSWRTVLNAQFEFCGVCAPKKPKMVWVVQKDGKERPREDPRDAARYEHESKARPDVFKVFTRKNIKGEGSMCFALNIKALMHRACAKLAGRVDKHSHVEFFWRMRTGEDLNNLRLGNFRLLNNNGGPEEVQPPNFDELQLRPEQLRSLRWMRDYESDEMASFQEEEVEEACLVPLTWRAEAKVIVHRTARGGILADHVGFGKTALILAMIDAQHDKDVMESKELCENAIPVKATLIVVPDILFDQWQVEVTRFLGRKYEILCIANPKSLKSKSIKDFQKADIIIVSWPVFTGAGYYDRLEQVAGGPLPPRVKTGRMFEEWFRDVYTSIESQTKTLQSEGPQQFLEAIQSKRENSWGTDSYDRYLPSKRLRGKLARQDHGPEKGGKKRKMADIGSEPNEAEYSNAKPTKGASHSDFGIRNDGNPAIGDVQNIVFQMFRFQRLVIDEFTYLDFDKHVLLSSINARSRWLLSGTPPIGDFSEVNSIARLLDVYLGRDNGQTVDLRGVNSDAEVFQSYRRVESNEWHFRRHGLAQNFLDRFMRQNVPEIPEIPLTAHYEAFELSAVERILYIEMKLFFESCNARVRPNNKFKFGHDQPGRINEILDTCDTFEQALVKRCSHLELSPTWSSATSALDTVAKVISQRRSEIEELLRVVKHDLRLAVWLFHHLGQSDPHFKKLQESVSTHDFGDAEVTDAAEQLIQTALDAYDESHRAEFWSEEPPKGTKGRARKDSENDGDGDEGNTPTKKKAKLSAPGKKAARSLRKATENEEAEDRLPPFPGNTELEKLLRQTAMSLRSNVSKWVDQHRAWRFIVAAENFQTGRNVPPCSHCDCKNGIPMTHNVLTKCGHVVCSDCIEEVVKGGQCPIVHCRGAVGEQNVINGIHFGKYTEEKPAPDGGTRLARLIALLNDTTKIPSEDRVILFVQFEEAVKSISAALDENGIPFVAVGGRVHGARQKVKKFTANSNAGADQAKVLILMLGTENAAGINLQMANHVIFFAQMAAANQYQHQSSMTQATGRAVRFGQKKHVHVWYLLALNTLDVGILQSQNNRVLVRRPSGEFDFVVSHDGPGGVTGGFEQPAYRRAW